MYDTTTIGTSATIIAPAGAEIKDGALLAVKFDSSGKLVLAGEGDIPVGIIPGGVPDTVKMDEDLTVQIKGTGLCKAGGAIATGAYVACGAGGKVVTAANGVPIFGQALSAADSDGVVLRIQILKGGYAPSAASAS